MKEFQEYEAAPPIMSESRFYMWRAVFAMAHADGILAPQEHDMLTEFIEKRPFMPAQREILKSDLEVPQDIDALFDKISEDKDREDFFDLARALAWCDGNYAEQERVILERLKKQSGMQHVKTELHNSRQTQMSEKLHDMFEKTGFGGMLDSVDKRKGE